MDKKENLRISVYQSAADPGRSLAERLEALDAVLSGLSSRVDCLICPELYMTGYGAARDHQVLAQSSHGQFADSVAKLARKHGCCIVYGYPEKEESSIYNSALAIGHDGMVLANHRKIVLPNDYERNLFSSGDEFTFFYIHGWRIALIVCYEVEFPEIVRFSAVQGADLVVVPTALKSMWGVVAHQVVPARAFENGVFLAYANYAGHEGETEYLGASCIIGPSGEDLARAGESEQVIMADLDIHRLHSARGTLQFLEEHERISGIIGSAGNYPAAAQ